MIIGHKRMAKIGMVLDTFTIKWDGVEIEIKDSSHYGSTEKLFTVFINYITIIIDEVRLGQVRSGKVKASQVRSSHVRAGQVRSGWFR